MASFRRYCKFLSTGTSRAAIDHKFLTWGDVNGDNNGDDCGDCDNCDDGDNCGDGNDCGYDDGDVDDCGDDCGNCDDCDDGDNCGDDDGDDDNSDGGYDDRVSHDENASEMIYAQTKFYLPVKSMLRKAIQVCQVLFSISIIFRSGGFISFSYLRTLDYAIFIFCACLYKI